MAAEKGMYFLALVPEGDELEKLKALKQSFSIRYSTKAALKSPPHVTLHMPFKFRLDREQHLIRSLSDFCKESYPLDLTIDGYGSFPPRVIYLHIKPNSNLKGLQAALMKHMKIEHGIFNANYRDKPFVPHLTLAFRDLKKEQFYLAWNEVENLSYTVCWQATNVSLLKHNGQEWEILKRLYLKVNDEDL